jgi:hypothetical protein
MAVTYEEWMRDIQGVDIEKMKDEERVAWRQQYDEAMRRDIEWRKRAAPSRGSGHKDYRYAIVIDDDSGSSLAFWIKRSAKGEIFFLYPRDSETNPHASYHLDGKYHQKICDVKTNVQQRQPLNDRFEGTEHLGMFMGFGAGPCMRDMSHFDVVVVAPPGSLSGRSGVILVDLIAPGALPAPHHRERLQIVAECVFHDAVPGIVIAIATR